MLVLKKHSSACSGEFTMGSFSLNDVLSSMGYAGFFSKGFNQLIIPRRCVPVHRLQPAGPVHMCDSRNQGLLFLADRKYFFHKGHVVVHFKIFIHIFFQNRRGEGPGTLPSLYF